MKAAQFHPDTVKISLESIPIPQPKDDEILVRTISSGLCHSDLVYLQRHARAQCPDRLTFAQMVLDGSSPIAPSKPVTVGHEACGEIVDLGPAVTGFSKGDKVGFVNAYHACWECAGCARHYGQCESGDFVMQGWGMDGFMQEYCIVDYRAATVLPDALDASKAAPLFCAGITAYNAVRTPGLKEGQWLAVIGCGGLGQMGEQN